MVVVVIENEGMVVVTVVVVAEAPQELWQPKNNSTTINQDAPYVCASDFTQSLRNGR